MSIYSQLKETKKDVISSLPKAIEQSMITESFARDHIHVQRKDVETKISLALCDIEKYYIVYGPKGAGKSEIVHHVALEKEAVIKVDVTSAQTKEDIIKILCRKLVGSDMTAVDLDDLVKAIKISKRMPTIIFDVERGGSVDQIIGLEAVRSLSKMLAPCCHCMIVLSEVNAVLEFGKDPEREGFIYIDEMSTEEATTLLRNLKVTLTEQEIKYVFDNIGTTPAMVKSLARHMKNKQPLQEFVDSRIAYATQTLDAFPHKAILNALKEHPEGVYPRYFKNQVHRGVDLTVPQAVGTAMKRSNAIVYRIELGMYKMMSTAHQTALKNYDPVLVD
jgi:5-bromo-4-chloroindolyl phosphate hydrolysis protein